MTLQTKATMGKLERKTVRKIVLGEFENDSFLSKLEHNIQVFIYH